MVLLTPVQFLVRASYCFNSWQKKNAEGKSVCLQEDTCKILDAGFWPKFIITHSQ